MHALTPLDSRSTSLFLHRARMMGAERLLAHSKAQQQKCPLLKGVLSFPPSPGKSAPPLFRNARPFA